MIYVFKEWEEVLTPKMHTILDKLEEIYYQGDVDKALEMEYHFPRHSHFLAAD